MTEIPSLNLKEVYRQVDALKAEFPDLIFDPARYSHSPYYRITTVANTPSVKPQPSKHLLWRPR